MLGVSYAQQQTPWLGQLVPSLQHPLLPSWSPADAAVLAGHVLAVPVVGRAAGEAEVGVALADGQVALLHCLVLHWACSGSRESGSGLQRDALSGERPGAEPNDRPEPRGPVLAHRRHTGEEEGATPGPTRTLTAPLFPASPLERECCLRTYSAAIAHMGRRALTAGHPGLSVRALGGSLSAQASVHNCRPHPDAITGLLSQEQTTNSRRISSVREVLGSHLDLPSILCQLYYDSKVK